jgi:plasmid maintenance system antidote protein VapI
VWINLQAHYDLEVARDELEEQVAQEVTPYPRPEQDTTLLALV